MIEIEIKRGGKNDYDIIVDGQYCGSRATYAEALRDGEATRYELMLEAANRTDDIEWYDFDLTAALNEVKAIAEQAAESAMRRNDLAKSHEYTQFARSCARAAKTPALWRRNNGVFEVLSTNDKEVYAPRQGGCTCPARVACRHRAIRAAVLQAKL